MMERTGLLEENPKHLKALYLWEGCMETAAKHTGNVQTVLGMISADSMGITITHENLCHD